MATTINNNECLPAEVEDLIDRRLRLMRRQEEMQLNGVKTTMWRSVATHIRAGLDSSRSNTAIPLGTLAAYRDAAERLLRVTDDWPDAVWKTIEPILDYVSITPNHGDSIARLLYIHAWPAGDVPWTASWLDAERFAEGV